MWRNSISARVCTEAFSASTAERMQSPNLLVRQTQDIGARGDFPPYAEGAHLRQIRAGRRAASHPGALPRLPNWPWPPPAN